MMQNTNIQGGGSPHPGRRKRRVSNKLFCNLLFLQSFFMFQSHEMVMANAENARTDSSTSFFANSRHSRNIQAPAIDGDSRPDIVKTVLTVPTNSTNSTTKSAAVSSPTFFGLSPPAPASEPAIFPSTTSKQSKKDGASSSSSSTRTKESKSTGIPGFKTKKAKKFKSDTDDTIFGKTIAKKLKSKKKKKIDAKLRKKKKAKKYKSGVISYIIPWRSTDPETGLRSNDPETGLPVNTREIICPNDPSELWIASDPEGELDLLWTDNDDDWTVNQILCHNAALGPSVAPSISHAPSNSPLPSMSPSISHAPSVSFAPSKTHKGMTCRSRPVPPEPSMSPSVSVFPSLAVTLSPSVVPSVMKVEKPASIDEINVTMSNNDTMMSNDTIISKDIIMSNDTIIRNDTDVTIETSDNSTRRLQNSSMNPDSELISSDANQSSLPIVPQFSPFDLLAIEGGWDPTGPNSRPKFWYTLPYCDEVPSISPAPSDFVPSLDPTLSHAPTSSPVPSLSTLPSLMPSRPGFKGDWIGNGCELARLGVVHMGVGEFVEVRFLYELVTDRNVTESGVLQDMENAMQEVVNPVLLGCLESDVEESVNDGVNASDLGNGTRRMLQSQSGVEYVIPEPEDALAEDAICKGGLPIGPDEACYRVLTKMTAVVPENFPYISNLIETDVMGAVKPSLNDGTYHDDSKGIFQTLFIGIDVGTTIEPPPAGISVITPPEQNITAFGGSMIGIASAGVLVIVLLLVRKRQYTSTVIMEELQDDDDPDLYKDSPKHETATVRTTLSSPNSHFSADLDASPQRFVQVLGSSPKDSSIVDDLRTSEQSTALHSPYQGSNGKICLPTSQNPTRDVHQCTSAMCEICKPWKNYDPTFIPTNSGGEASPEAKAPRSDYKLERKRAYKMEDTVVL